MALSRPSAPTHALRSETHFSFLLGSNKKLKRPQLGVRGGGFSLQTFLTSASACSRELVDVLAHLGDVFARRLYVDDEAFSVGCADNPPIRERRIDEGEHKKNR